MVRLGLVLDYFFIFSLGLVIGYLTVHVFLFLGDGLVIGLVNDYRFRPIFRLGLRFFEVVLIKNSQFSMAIYLLGFNRVVQYLVMFIAGLVSGFLIASLAPWCAALGLAPHGVLELLGYSVAGVGGYEYFGLRKVSLRASLIRYLLPSLALLVVAAFIESFVTIKVVSIICG